MKTTIVMGLLGKAKRVVTFTAEAQCMGFKEFILVIENIEPLYIIFDFLREK